MPICSYVLTPVSGSVETLVAELDQQPGCKAFPADKGELVILLTESYNDEQEKELHSFLKFNEHIQSFSLSFGELKENSHEAS